MVSLLKRQSLVNPQIQRIRELARQKPKRFIENFVSIDDRMGQVVPFRFNWAQRQYYRIIQEERAKNKPVRLWIVKWRRAGLTSATAALAFTRAYSYDNARVGVLAHEEDRSKEILQKMKFYYETLPPEMQIQLAKDNVFGIRYDNVRGQVLIGTANNPMKIRGDGLQWIDLTEGAHYGYQFKLVMDEVCPVVPALPDTGIVVDTTGSIRGCEAHAHAMAAQNGDNEFRYEFLCWRDSPECQIPFDSDRHREQVFSEMHEKEPRLLELSRHFKMTPEQTHQLWHFYKYGGNNDFDYTVREWPPSSEYAWSAGGASFFGTHEVNTVSAQDPIAIYKFDNMYLNQVFQSFDGLRQVDDIANYGPYPHVKIWSLPRTGGRYVIGADSAMGESYGDFSAGYVIDIGTREMLASFHGRMRPDETAHLMVSLARIYNNALLAPESNPGGGGLTVLQDIQRIGYFNIYVWRKRDSVEGLKLSQSAGWWTTPRSRPMMLGELRKVFLDCVHGKIPGDNVFRDRALIEEMRTFSPNPNNNIPAAMPGCYDDRVIGLAISHQAAADEAFCTGQDLIHAYHKYQPAKPMDQRRLVQRVKPSNVMSVLMGKSSPLNKRSFEMNSEGRISGWPSM